MGMESYPKKEQRELSQLERNIEELKKEPEYERVPLHLRELLDGETEQRGLFFQAVQQAIQFERMRDVGGLKERDVQLMARSTNPYELAQFTREEIVRLREIKDQIYEGQRKAEQS